MKRTLLKRVIAVCLVLLLSASAVFIAAAANKKSVGAPPRVCTVIAGKPLTFTAGRTIASGKSSKKSMARVSRSGREITVKAQATGSAVLTLTDTRGNSRTIDVYTYASRAQYDYLCTLFQGKTFSVLGDSISTLEPWDTGASHYYDVARADNCGDDSGYVDKKGRRTGGIGLRYQDTYWGNLQTRFQMRLLRNVSCKHKTVTGWMQEDAQIRSLGKKGAPDVIFFYGGSNDIRRSKSLPAFRAAYAQVLHKLKDAYPNAFILALLPYADGYAPYQKAAIRACKDAQITYVPLSKAGLTTLHPHEAGFAKITACILNTLYANRNKVPASTAAATEPAAEPVTEIPPEPPVADVPAGSGIDNVLRMLDRIRRMYTQQTHSVTAEDLLQSSALAAAA